METTADLPEGLFITHTVGHCSLYYCHCVTPPLVVLFCHCSVTATVTVTKSVVWCEGVCVSV
jgi:hypothetical protein